MATPIIHKNNLNSNFKFDNTNKKVYTNYMSRITLAELRAFSAIDVSHNPVVYIIDSGKEGVFVYDNTDTTSTDDTGVVIKTNTGNYIYKRKYKNAVNVKWFGAKGDGLTDDTTAIQNALTLYDDVFVPKGTYLVNGLNFKSNNTLRGDGKSAILKANFDTARIINIYNTSVVIENVTVEDLTLDGGGQTTNIYTGIKRAYGVYISKAQNIRINNLLIKKCGVANSAAPKTDVNHGGYGILAESRNGEIRNIRISNIDVFDIAGGGMQMGDGIIINGFNSNTSIVPYNVVVENCHVERVGRHCISIGGEPPESLSRNVYVKNFYGKNAALCGLDYEDATYSTFENFHFENCGTYNGYYNVTTEYGAEYGLRAGIAYGNLSSFCTIRNGQVNDCQHGMTVGGGTDNKFENISFSGSVYRDMSLKLVQIGARTRFDNIKLNTTGKPINPFYNAQDKCELIFENSVFASVIEMGGLQDSIFRNCTFKETLNINNTGETKFLTFDNCNFYSTGSGFAIPSSSSLENITFDGCLFEGCLAGINLVLNSIFKSKLINNTFKNCTTAVSHANSDSQNSFDIISNNVFESCTTGLFFWQGLRDCNIINNRFKSVSGWCIDFGTVSATAGARGLIVTDNAADASCNNGLRLQLGGVGGVGFDWCTITDNDFGRVAVTPYLINAGNINGYYVPDRKTSFNSQVGTSYQFGYFDLYRTVVRNATTAGTSTIPNDATLNYPIGAVIDVENIGDGEMLINGLLGVVINNSLESSPIIRSRGKVKLVKTAANTWSLNGDLKPKRFKLASNFINNSPISIDIPEFSFPVRAGNEYMIDVIIVFNTSNAAIGAKLGVYLPSGTGTIYGFLNGQITNGAASTDLTAAITSIGASNTSFSFLLTTATSGAGVNHIMQGRLIFNCTSNGTLQFQWASEGLLVNTVLVAGSRIFVKEI